LYWLVSSIYFSFRQSPARDDAEILFRRQEWSWIGADATESLVAEFGSGASCVHLGSDFWSMLADYYSADVYY
jgi:hypothetical protein